MRFVRIGTARIAIDRVVAYTEKRVEAPNPGTWAHSIQSWTHVVFDGGGSIVVKCHPDEFEKILTSGGETDGRQA